MTNDPNILDAVKHYHIEFSDIVPIEGSNDIPLQTARWFSASERTIMNEQIEKLLDKGVIFKSTLESGGFISTIFLIPKKDGTHRLILNLKNLNEYVAYHHFKMDNIQTVLKLIRPGCFMASVDLKDAYYSVLWPKYIRNF